MFFWVLANSFNGILKNLWLAFFDMWYQIAQKKPYICPKGFLKYNSEIVNHQNLWTTNFLKWSIYKTCSR